MRELPYESTVQSYRDTLRAERRDNLRGPAEIAMLGTLIDFADDSGREFGLRRAIQWAERIVSRAETPATHKALIHYFAANAWAALRRLLRRDEARIDWEQPESEREIAHLRHAKSVMVASLDPLRQCQILTNLGNALNSRGRLVEAMIEWDAALTIDPSFAMAHGNRGAGLWWYARVHHDPGHSAYLVRAAHAALSSALTVEDAHVHPMTRRGFADLKSKIEQSVPTAILESPSTQHEHRYWPPDEAAYRRWCARERLFLSSLNDLGPLDIAMADVLMLPTLVTALNEGPTLLGFFNQLKQEYVAARWLTYDGIHHDGVHFADRDVTLINTLDYPTYSIRAEQVKLAFRAAYSIFDKLALFLNDYFGLGIREHRVLFRTVWFEKEDPERGLREVLRARNNIFLQALFWLSKDFFEESVPVAHDVEPMARRIATIRNELEHKYLKLHEMMVGLDQGRNPEPAHDHDRLAYSMSRRELENETLALLRRTRAGLMYVAFAVRLEEDRRDRERDSGGLNVSVISDVWEDDWKV